MSKQSLFNHIRSEDVVLWIGAGFSKYAGYPLGSSLKELIAESLSESERVLIDSNLQLADYAEEFVRLKNGSRNEIIKLVRDTYRKPPATLSNHLNLTAIPHFKNIITTNYDPLLEIAYGDKGNLIYREMDIGLLDKRKVNIIKIHGDLSDSESIIITKSDYAAFYKQDWSSPFWAYLATLMATNVLLFVGYSLEDPNVIAMLEHIAKYLKKMRKEAFYVAPNVAQHRVAHLNRLGIEVIQGTGEQLLIEIEEDIRLNIFGDQRLQKVTADTFLAYFKNKNLLPDLISTSKGFQVASVRTTDGKLADGIVKLEYAPESEFAKLKQAFFRGEIHELIVSKEMLKDFQYDIGGIRMMGQNDIEELRIRSNPVDYKFDLSFPGLDLDFENLVASVQHSFTPRIKVKLHHLDINIIFSKKNDGSGDVELEIKRNIIHESVRSAIRAYRFVKYFFEQQPFTIYLHNNGSIINKKSYQYRKDFIDEADWFIKYFESLKEVEGFYGIKFRDITDIDLESFNKLQRLEKIANGKSFKLVDGPIRITMTEMNQTTVEFCKRLETEDAPLDIELTINEIVHLHGCDIKLSSQRIHVPSARVKNLKRLITGKTREIEVISRSGRIYTYYQEPFNKTR
ncbi:SIR2 family protein [Mucilaginibacter defluvii]|uniref:SIR2-like protein n=1 Tax=Mucilaginibacter defluvii TaxID=1196019 RepID=A0ABP9FFG9_9SPHI